MQHPAMQQKMTLIPQAHWPACPALPAQHPHLPSEGARPSHFATVLLFSQLARELLPLLVLPPLGCVLRLPPPRMALLLRHYPLHRVSLASPPRGPLPFQGLIPFHPTRLFRSVD